MQKKRSIFTFRFSRIRAALVSCGLWTKSKGRWAALSPSRSRWTASGWLRSMAEPNFKFTEAISLVVNCSSQQEIDEYWARLSDGGAEIQCGWLKDRFGLCWQVVPVNIAELLKHPKAFQAMLGMKKLVIADLEQAAGS
jgi:hypothetical protein